MLRAFFETFHVKPTFFPESTKTLLTVDEIVRYGCLLLGSKNSTSLFYRGKTLNVGFIDPRDKENVKLVKALLAGKAPGQKLHLFQLSLEEYLLVLEEVFQTGEEKLRSFPPEMISPVLRKHLLATIVNPS